VADERSWVEPEVQWPPAPFNGAVDIRLTNVGKTPVLESSTEANVEILDHDTPPLLNNQGLHTGNLANLIFPTKFIEVTARRYHSSGEIFRPTESEADALASGADYVTVYGTVMYSDQFGVHFTRFCEWKPYVSNSGFQYNASSCVGYRGVGEGKKIQKK
jgi:hypothetical protein